MRNKLMDLNNHLFEQLERLNDEDLKGKDLAEEISRARALTAVSSEIIKTGELMLNAQKHMDEYGYDNRGKKMPELLTNGVTDHDS